MRSESLPPPEPRDSTTSKALRSRKARLWAKTPAQLRGGVGGCSPRRGRFRALYARQPWYAQSLAVGRSTTPSPERATPLAARNDVRPVRSARQRQNCNVSARRSPHARLQMQPDAQSDTSASLRPVDASTQTALGSDARIARHAPRKLRRSIRDVATPKQPYTRTAGASHAILAARMQHLLGITRTPRRAEEVWRWHPQRSGRWLRRLRARALPS